jgi:hypothetical protein
MSLPLTVISSYPAGIGRRPHCPASGAILPAKIGDGKKKEGVELDWGNARMEGYSTPPKKNMEAARKTRYGSLVLGESNLKS